MRIFAVADFHREADLQEAAIEEANSGQYDLFIGLGDYEEPEYYENLVDPIDIPFVALTGNWDFGFEPPDNNEYTNLFNYKEVEFGDYRIVLLGAIYPDDYGEKIEAFFEDVPNEYRIVCSHYPPHMLGDLARTGTRAGFQEFRDLIMRHKPVLWMCGHIHEDFGAFELLDTTVLNCAAVESGKGWSIQLGEEGVEETEEVTLVEDPDAATDRL